MRKLTSPYTVRTIPFDGRETNHLARQPFGQIPFLSDGELEMFESGAGLLHLARKSHKLLPRDPVGEAETLQWTLAALNSIEMVTVPWWFLKISGDEDNDLAGWMGMRLDQLEKVLSEREWLAADRFTAADLLMADVLRVSAVRPFGNRPATEAYVARATDRPHSGRPVPIRLHISRRPTRRERRRGHDKRVLASTTSAMEADWDSILIP